MKLIKIFLFSILLSIIAILLFSKYIYIIETGEAGVLWKRFDGGIVTDEPPLGEGRQKVWPWNKVFVYKIGEQQELYLIETETLNNVDVKLDLIVSFRLKLNELGLLHQEVGTEYKERVLKSTVKEVTDT